MGDKILRHTGTSSSTLCGAAEYEESHGRPRSRGVIEVLPGVTHLPSGRSTGRATQQYRSSHQ